MTQHRQPQTSIHENLVQHVGCAEGLLKLMAQEKAALLATDLEGLAQLCEAKANAAQTLQALSLQLNRACGGDSADAGAYIEKSGDARLQKLWQQLMKLAVGCQQANLENGALLLERQTRVRSALQLLQPRDEKPLYGRSGASPLQASRRALALA